MPIIKSAIKRARQTKGHTVRNTAVKRRLKDATKALDTALASNSTKDLPALLSRVQSQLDTSVKKHLIHKNKAARLKSQYAAATKVAGGKTTKPAARAKKAAPKTKPRAKTTRTK